VIINKTTGAAVGNLYAYYNDSETYPGGAGKAVLSSGNIYYVGYMDLLDYGVNTYSIGGFLSYNAATGVPNLSVLPLFSDPQNYPYYLSPPRSLTVLNGIIYFVGIFREVNGTAREGAAAVDATSGALYSWRPDVYSLGSANDITTDGTYIYVYGSFNAVNGTSRRSFAVLDTNGALVSTKQIYGPGGGGGQVTNNGLSLQLVPDGVMLVVGSVLKVWDTRFQSPRN
jgi:hypothetical protein